MDPKIGFRSLGLSYSSLYLVLAMPSGNLAVLSQVFSESDVPHGMVVWEGFLVVSLSRIEWCLGVQVFWHPLGFCAPALTNEA